MKILKYIGFIILITIVLGLLFQKQITSTALFLIVSQSITNDPVVFTKLEIYQPQLSESVETKEIIQIDNISVPVVFSRSDVREGDFGEVILGEGKSLWVSKNEIRYSESVFSELPLDEYKAVCDSLYQATDWNACDSEFDFWKSVFLLDPTSTHWYSSTRKKVGLSLLTPLKMSHGTTDKEFELDTVRGFITEMDKGSTVTVFTATDDSYQLILGGYSQAEVDHTLLGINLK